MSQSDKERQPATLKSSLRAREDYEKSETKIGKYTVSEIWRKMLLMQFNTYFIILILMSCYLSFVCTIMDATFAYSTNEKNVPKTYTATLLGT